MKILLIIYDVDFDEDVMEAISACPVTGYTKWDRVLGKGAQSDPKLDDAVWPGYNCAMVVAIEDEIKEEVVAAMTALSERLGGKGFKVFELPVSKVI